MDLKKFYPVIHCICPQEKQGVGHAIRNTRIALENGADGVFLIGHGMHFHDLAEIYGDVRKQFLEAWIGVNFLDIAATKNWDGLSSLARRCEGLNALWIDGMPNKKLDVPPSIQIFGGVAFKYLAPHLSGRALAEECEHAAWYVDVATTSGSSTGSAPSVEKLKTIRGHLEGRIPLAVASGVSADNIRLFFEDADIFLVASSICERYTAYGNEEYLVPEKVRTIAAIVRQGE